MRIGLLWHTLRHPNLGVDALTRSNLSIIASAAQKVGIQPEFMTLGQNFLPGRDPEFPNVEIGSAPSLKGMIKRREKFWADVASCDVIFDIGEGDSFTDIYGLRRYVQQMVTKLIVRLNGVPLVLSPQTIGPFNKSWTGALAALLMRSCTKVFSRDPLSTEFLHKLKVRRNIDEFVDVAFRLPYTKAERHDDRIRVGLNVSALLYNGGYTGKNEFGLALDYADFTHKILDFFSGGQTSI